MDNLQCTWSYNDLFIGTRNNVAQCCMQGKGWDAPDWNTITNLNEWYANFEPFIEVRNQHLKNIQNIECKRCWNYENKNIPSSRIRTNGKQIEDFGSLPVVPEVKRIELRFSNKCNLRCRMCDGNSSSQIQNLVNELLDKGIKDTYTTDVINYKEFQNIEKLLDLIIKCETIEEIQVAGGEPFIMPEVEWLLKELVKHNKTHISLKFITNLTSTKTKIIELIKKFKKVEFDLSIDGIGDVIEYQRYPVKWKTVEKNFLSLYRHQNKDFKLKFTPCISHLNLFGLSDLINWSRNYPEVTWGFNLVNSPSYLDYRLIPLEYRKDLIKELQNIDIDFMPYYVRQMYKNFFEKGISDFREITDKEKQQLKDAINFWDYKSLLKYSNIYPWNKELNK